MLKKILSVSVLCPIFYFLQLSETIALNSEEEQKTTVG